MKTQVTNSHYFTESYNSKIRFLSYYYQFNLLMSLLVNTIIEIGVGNGFVKSLVKHHKEHYSLDFDKNLRPDIVGDVTNFPIKDNSIDAVVAFEVFEHLPYVTFLDAVKNIYSICTKFLIFSVPEKTRFYWINIKVPKIPGCEYCFEIPERKPPAHYYNGEHYWELGKKDFPKERIITDVENIGYKLIKTIRPIDLKWHRFFIFQK